MRTLFGSSLLIAFLGLTSIAWHPVSAPSHREKAAPPHLKFQVGTVDHLAISEVLKIVMHFPQVDQEVLRPSTRITDYDFTERIDSLLPNGSAYVAIVLDSFKTRIILGEGRDKEEFFSFNSNNDDDLRTKLHDIKTLPRAQFLGQTLRFVVGTDGQIVRFENLAQFHQNSLGSEADYDFIHAMLSLSDSLRMSQLLEHGFGAVAAGRALRGEPFTSAYTATEVPIKRSLAMTTRKITHKGEDSIGFVARYYDAPPRIDYLEGLAANLGVSDYKGSGNGFAIIENGMVTSAAIRDTSMLKLQVDIETVPEEIYRYVTETRSPIDVLHGGEVHIVDKKEHRGIPKPPPVTPDSGARVIDVH